MRSTKIVYNFVSVCRSARNVQAFCAIPEVNAVEIISADKLCYSYPDNSKQYALNSFSFSIKKGELVAILGGCGSGKTTLAKLMNVLLPLQGGNLRIVGNDIHDTMRVWQIRKSCGTVFQDIDSQIVAPYVEENVAFAARNFGADAARLSTLTHNALEFVGMRGYERRRVQNLSPLYRFLTLLAGVIAAEPDIIVLDNALVTLSPFEKDIARQNILKLNSSGITVLLMTDNADDAAIAERVILLHKGEKLADGAPHSILADRALMQEAGIAMPFAARVYNDLLDAGIHPDICPLTLEELAKLV